MIEMYNQDFNSVEIILASNSPRRKQFFKEAGIPFTIKTFEVDEIFDPSLKGAAISNYLVKLKAAPFQDHIQSNQIVVTADTIVWGDEQYLGKPKTKADAKQMLRLLSGKEHQVITSVAFTQKNKQLLIHETSSVTFKKLSDQEIEFYLNEFEPMDKAGAYGIQEWIGTIGIERIEGSYTNIVGLPMAQVLQCLIKLTSN
jgi:septum formation protein